jgi:3-hydroxyisobutyrate dehydrogenase
MASRLLDVPDGLWVHDVDSAAVASLAEQGVRAAGSPAELAAHTDRICIMVRDDAQVWAVLSGPDGIFSAARPGTVIIVHSTIHPDTAAELCDAAAAHGLHLLDAPVSGGAMGAAKGSLAILVGGDPAAFEQSRDVLERMGELVELMGPIGAGTAAKLARNLLHFVAFTAATEAMQLADAAGIDLATLGKVVRHTDAITGGPGAIMWRAATGPIAADDAWLPIMTHVSQLGEKDLSYAIELGARFGVETPLARLAAARLASGLGV